MNYKELIPLSLFPNQQNLYSPLITIIPLTSQLDKIYPFEVETDLNNQKRQDPHEKNYKIRKYNK